MKLYEVVEPIDPFKEPKLTAKEELEFLRHRILYLDKKMLEVHKKAWLRYKDNFSEITSLANARSFHGLVVEIPSLRGKAFIYGIFTYNPALKATGLLHQQFLVQKRREAEKIKTEYKLARSRADRLQTRLEAINET